MTVQTMRMTGSEIGPAGREALIFGYGARPEPAPAAPRRLLWGDPATGETPSGIQMLRRHGFDVRQVSTPQALRAALAAEPVDVVLIEAVWPEEDGLSLCKELASAGAPPLVIYSSSTDSVDCVTGLEFGADDYVAKSAHPLELLARVRALLRRLNAQSKDSPSAVRRWRFHDTLRCVVGPDGHTSYLSAADTQLLGYLAARPRQVVTRGEILAELCAGGFNIAARAVDTRVTRLRRALDRCEGAGAMIATVRGGGYALNAHVEPGPDGSLQIAAAKPAES